MTESPIPEKRPALESGDYYMDGEYLVFTAEYHRKRGFCCGSKCRHCPYGEDDNADLGEVNTSH